VNAIVFIARPHAKLRSAL